VTPAEVAAGYLGSFSSGDPDEIAGWVTDDFVNEHTAALGTGCEGREAYRQRLPGFLRTFEGLRYDVDEIVSQGDRAVAAYTMRADFQEKPIVIRGVQRLEVRDDKIAHRIDYWDSLQFILQADPTVRSQLEHWLG
jgi:ketosteroid isomerase-like protein